MKLSKLKQIVDEAFLAYGDIDVFGHDRNIDFDPEDPGYISSIVVTDSDPPAFVVTVKP